MRAPFWLKKRFFQIADRCYTQWPQPFPPFERIKSCRVVSHRGEHDNVDVFENTLRAFEVLMDHGVWGIEFDVRWTRDLQPVVFHDRDCWRLFGSRAQINQMTLTELKRMFPQIPSLEEVIRRCGQKLHLMIEIKEEHYPDPAYQRGILKGLLGGLEPERDFHILSLTPRMFQFIDFMPNSTLLPIAELNVPKLSSLALRKKYGGIAGHYLLLSDTVLQKHKKLAQKVGTGYISSRNCLFRELNRGVDWVFSNNALEIQSLCHRLGK